MNVTGAVSQLKNPVVNGPTESGRSMLMLNSYMQMKAKITKYND
jgi:hypothetical protein